MSRRDFSILNIVLTAIALMIAVHSSDERAFRDEVREYMREQRECP